MAGRRKSRIAVTDHALVRWLDRTGAMDVEQFRDLLAKSLERASKAARQLDSSKYLILAAGMVFVVRDGTVVTVYEDDGRHAQAHRRRRRRK